MSQLETLAQQTVYGLTLRTDNATELSGKGTIGETWQRFYQDIAPQLPKDATICALYHDYASDVDGQYSLLIGSNRRCGDSEATLSAGCYRHFHKNGEAPQATIALWQEIWRYYAENPQEKRCYDTDLEQYDAQGVSIYIGVEQA